MNAMPRKTSNTGEASETPISFEPVLRQNNRDSIAEWRLTPEATDYSVKDASTYIQGNGAASIEQQAATWRSLGYVSGIKVLHKWTTTPTHIPLLAGYSGMSVPALFNFTDTIG